MKQETVLTVDDLDGGPDAAPVRFSVDGHNYEIDLREENRVRLAEALLPYIAASRRIRRRKH